MASTRVPVLDRVRAQLDQTSWPAWQTHNQIAQFVYETRRPTPAQLAAVRRATSKLVREGVAIVTDKRPPIDSASRAARGDRVYIRRDGAARYRPAGKGFARAPRTDDERQQLADNERRQAMRRQLQQTYRQMREVIGD